MKLFARTYVCVRLMNVRFEPCSSTTCHVGADSQSSDRFIELRRVDLVLFRFVH
jgi:hypothetical protein